MTNRKPQTDEGKYEALPALCAFDFEKAVLNKIRGRGLRLPDESQKNYL